MIKGRKPRQEQELLSCFVDLINKIETYTRLQDVVSRKSNAELAALTGKVAQLEAELAELTERVTLLETRLTALTNRVARLE